MKTVFFNELRLYFYSWLGWSAILILNIIAFLGFNAGAASYGKFNAFFEMMQMPFAWSILIVGARTLAKDRELGLFNLFFTSPITLQQLLLGKFLALYVFFMLIVISLLFYPLITVFFIKISWLSVASGLLALSLVLLLFCGITLFASASAVNSLVAIVIGFGIWIFLALLGPISQGLSSSTFKILIENFAYTAHFDNIISGVFGWDDLLFFIFSSCFFIKLSEAQILSQIAC